MRWPPISRRSRSSSARAPTRCWPSCRPSTLEWLDAYTAGVNAGLEDLRARPPEYWLFGARPEAWQNEDSVLVVFAFYTMLSNNDSFERTQGLLHDVVPRGRV